MTTPEDELAQLAGSPWRTIMSADGWKLNLSAEDQRELHDLNADPYEQVNLFDEPSQQDRVRDLASRLRAWQERINDTAPLPEIR